MKFKKSKNIFLMALFFFIFSFLSVENLFSESSQEIPLEFKNGREVQLKVKHRYTGDDAMGDSTMKLISRTGYVRIRDFNRFVKDYNGAKKVIIRLKSPPDIRLTAFLVWEEEGTDTQFLYLPAMKKTRRISSKDRDQSFVGSDFSLYDMGNIEMEDFTYSDVTLDTVDGRECYRYDCILAPGGDAPYNRVETWVDRERFLRIKMIFYDRRRKLLKTLTTKDVRLTQNIWTPHYFLMENHQDGHKTEFIMKNVIYNYGVPEDLFQLVNMERARDINIEIPDERSYNKGMNE